MTDTVSNNAGIYRRQYKYFKTDKGKAALKRYRESEKGRATIFRRNQRRRISSTPVITVEEEK